MSFFTLFFWGISRFFVFLTVVFNAKSHGKKNVEADFRSP